MSWIQEAENIYTNGGASDRKVCLSVTCKGYNGCISNICICYVAYPCSSKGMPY